MSDLGLLILRVSAGGMMLTHGWPKLMRFSELMSTFPDPLGVGAPLSLGLTVFAEVFCSLAVILGVATRLAAVPLLITMLVAALVIHAEDPFGKKEMALLYASIFAALVATGTGSMGLGQRWMKPRWLH